MYIVIENFEFLVQIGGYEYYKDCYGNVMKFLVGMVCWSLMVNDKLVCKGGVGIYYMEYDYFMIFVDYKYLCEVIGIMNLVVKK